MDFQILLFMLRSQLSVYGSFFKDTLFSVCSHLDFLQSLHKLSRCGFLPVLFEVHWLHGICGLVPLTMPGKLSAILSLNNDSYFFGLFLGMLFHICCIFLLCLTSLMLSYVTSILSSLSVFSLDVSIDLFACSSILSSPGLIFY